MSNFSDYVTLAIAIHGLALVIVNITPTPKDNEYLDGATKVLVKAYRAVEILAGIVSRKAKQ